MKWIAGLVFAGAAWAGTASAADIAPMQAHLTRLPGDVSVMVFFTPERDGFHVVTTTQEGIGPTAHVARFVTVLTHRQAGAVSIPTGGALYEKGVAPTVLTFSRDGARLHIDEPEQVASAR